MNPRTEGELGRPTLSVFLRGGASLPRAESAGRCAFRAGGGEGEAVSGSRGWALGGASLWGGAGGGPGVSECRTWNGAPPDCECMFMIGISPMIIRLVMVLGAYCVSCHVSNGSHVYLLNTPPAGAG